MIQNRGTEATEDTEVAALFHEVLLRGLEVDRQVVVPVAYKGFELNAGIRLDLRIAHRVIVEVKSVERLHQIHRAQLLTYLKLTGLRIGLLFNFNVEFLRNGMRRVVN
jgi:GxxExxY protein